MTMATTPGHKPTPRPTATSRPTVTSSPTATSRLRVTDALRIGGSGLRTRPLRIVLSALGIMIGIAAMLSVVGISSSSRAQLDQMLSRLGTNLLVAGPGQTIFGNHSQLPVQAVAMVRRIGPVISATATASLSASVYRNDHVPSGETKGIAVLAARSDLLDTVGGHVGVGVWLSKAAETYPVVVLGAEAARRLGVDRLGTRVWLGGLWFGVVGILDPVPLARELDAAALVGWDAATTYLGLDGHPTTIYCRADESQVEAVRGVLGPTVNPASPNEVAVSRPSDALAAARATDTTFTALLLGLGAVALLVGGVGVANTMIISVLERRAEIGLRRSLGATRGHVRVQFLAEAALLAGLGGSGGVLLGAGVTAAFARLQGWPVVVPAWAILGGLGATVVIGVTAGLYPAIQAARLAPTEALALN